MDANTKLQLTYEELKEMIEEAQRDALNADGCSCGIHYDADEEIELEIKRGYIKVIEGE